MVKLLGKLVKAAAIVVLFFGLVAVWGLSRPAHQAPPTARAVASVPQTVQASPEVIAPAGCLPSSRRRESRSLLIGVPDASFAKSGSAFEEATTAQAIDRLDDLANCPPRNQTPPLTPQPSTS